MKLRCLLLLSFICTASRAGTIPVKIIYEGIGARNLQGDSKLVVEEKTQVYNAIRNLDGKVQLSKDEIEEAPKHVPGQKIVTPEEVVQVQAKPDEVKEEFKPDDNWHSYLILQQAQEIVDNGLAKLKAKLHENMIDNVVKLDSLSKDIEEHINALKQENPNQNIIQNVLYAIGNATGNFIQNIGGNNPANTQGDEQRPTIGQNIVSAIQGKFLIVV